MSDIVFVAYRDGSEWARATSGSEVKIRHGSYAVLQACKVQTSRKAFLHVQLDEATTEQEIEINALRCDRTREGRVRGTLLRSPSGTPYVWTASDSHPGIPPMFDVLAPIGRSDIVVMFGTGVGLLISDDWAASVVSIVRDVDVADTPTQIEVDGEQALKLRRQPLVVKHVRNDEHLEVLQILRTRGGTEAWVTIDQTAPIDVVVPSPALYWAGELTTKVRAVGDGQSRTATVRDGVYVLAPSLERVVVLSKGTRPSFGWSAYKSASRYRLAVHQFRTESALSWTIQFHAGSRNYGALHVAFPDLSRVPGWSSEFELIPRTLASWQLRADEQAQRWGVWTPTGPLR